MNTKLNRYVKSSFYERNDRVTINDLISGLDTISQISPPVPPGIETNISYITILSPWYRKNSFSDITTCSPWNRQDISDITTLSPWYRKNSFLDITNCSTWNRQYISDITTLSPWYKNKYLRYHHPFSLV
jgi:hypothetical protein